jgi:uncharacterized membrane protein YkoI
MPEPDRGSAKWVRVAIVAGVLVLAFIAARSCQQAQVRVTEEEAIATAKEQVAFEPEGTQIRLLRQGLDRRPFWFVSLSITSDRDPDVFTRLAVVKIDANSGSVESIDQDAQRDRAASGAEISEEEAVEIAREEVDFTATETQVRLLRESGEPSVWAVSLSTSTSDTVTEVRIDAQSGEVATVEERAAGV